MTRILVLGGGPAGCVAAIGLAGRGHAVTLITARPKRAYFEGLSQRVVDGLRHAGCAAALASIGPWVRREAHWNGETAAANGEFLVERDRLDAALLADARGAGVSTVEGRVRRVEPTDSGWRVSVGDAAYDGAFLVEARGRRAPAGGRNRVHGPPTTALGRRWQGELGAPARTAACAFRDGWAWYGAGPDGAATLMIMVAGARLPPRRDLAKAYDQWLAAVPEASTWLAGAAPAGPVIARNANAVRARDVVGPRHVRVGDAALAIDPLSGHGVFEAVSTALTAVPVAATLLDRPDQADIARRYYRERIEHAFMRHARVGRAFYDRERRWPDAPFWRARARWPDLSPAHEPPDAMAPQVAWRPVVEGGYVTEREVVVTADHPRGIWRVAGIELVALMRVVDRGWELEATVVETAARALGQPAEPVSTALAWLRHRGLLTARAHHDAPA